jgi:hypothetical protein
MPSNPVQLDPGPWLKAAEQLGLGGALLLLVTLAFAIGIATRGPEWIRAATGALDVVLRHMREIRRVNKLAAKRKNETALAIEKRKRKVSPASGKPKP